MANSFLFKNSEEKVCFSCVHVIKNGQPILHVAHDLDGDWQFMCGKEDHSTSEGMIISLGEIVELDNSLNQVSDLVQGLCADRSAIGLSWSESESF